MVVGSQSVLLDWPDAPELMRTSGEIDAYPANYRDWEAANPGKEASEEINVLFGWGSSFHETFGFYIDGVDETTAKLPADWQARAVSLCVEDAGATITAIAPAPEDLAAAKLNRLLERDRAYIAARHRARPLDIPLVRKRFAATDPPPEIRAAALRFLEALEAGPG